MQQDADRWLMEGLLLPFLAVPIAGMTLCGLLQLAGRHMGEFSPVVAIGAVLLTFGGLGTGFLALLFAIITGRWFAALFATIAGVTSIWAFVRTFDLFS